MVVKMLRIQERSVGDKKKKKKSEGLVWFDLNKNK